MPKDQSRMNSQDPRLKEQRQTPQQSDEATPGKGENQAGFLKEKEAPASGSSGNTRESGESSSTSKGS